MISAALIRPAIDWAIDLMRAEIDAIKNNPSLPTYANTAEALEFAGADYSRVRGAISALFSSKTDDQLRAIEEIVKDKATKVSNEIWMDDVLFARLDAVHAARASLGLGAEETRLLEKLHRCFVNIGVNLDPAKKQRAQEISERLSALGNQFRNNDSDSMAAFEKFIDDPADLNGVSQDDLDRMAQEAADAGQPGKWLVKIDPSPTPILTY
jgi:peptidyl-dipeptidase Dcp